MRSLSSQAGVRSGMVSALRLRTTRSILIKTALRSPLRRNRRCVIYGVLTRSDPSLTLIQRQYSAIQGNAGNKKPLPMREFAVPCNCQQPLTRALVKRVGQGFESARRLSVFDIRQVALVSVPALVSVRTSNICSVW
jgi:hypothetical protein